MKRIGFRHAFRGVFIAVREESNMKIHLIAMTVVIGAGILGRLERWGWTAIITACALVISSELLNSSIERICDRITLENDTFIKDVKDMASGAVLVCAIASVIIAVIVFGQPYVLENWAGVFAMLST